MYVIITSQGIFVRCLKIIIIFFYHSLCETTGATQKPENLPSGLVFIPEA